MKLINRISIFTLLALMMTAPIAGVMAQTPDSVTQKTRQRLASKSAEQQKEATDTSAAKAMPAETDPARATGKKGTEASEESLATSATDDVVISQGASDVPSEALPNQHEMPSEEADIVQNYNNFFNTYRLGPEDIISVSVFGQDRYSRSGITIPPSGRISLALIPGGIFVNGKTVEEVAEVIKKRYDEYIIDPQVDVSLDKASSYRYSIIGDIASPGIRLMSHRMTVTEAIAEAGGVLPTGNRSKVVVLRRQSNGMLAPIAVNVSKIYKGQAPDNTYLVPGDQIFVPGNKFKTFQKIMGLASVLSFARIFTGGW